MYTRTLNKPTSTSVAPEFECLSFIETPKKLLLQCIKTWPVAMGQNNKSVTAKKCFCFKRFLDKKN
jgi:hypothetical protein